MKTCRKKIELENDKLRLEEMVKSLIKDKDKFADIAITTANTASSSMSAMKYFMTNFKNTPALKSIEDISNMKIEYKDDMSFIMQLLSVYQNNNLPDYIGEYIINIYKTTDSSKQSVWSSDVDRLTYIISEAVKDKTIWITDKKGIKVGERVIQPVLKYIKPILQTFTKDCRTEITKDQISSSRQAQILEYQKLAAHIIVYIDNKELEKDIIKYIAPKLYWNKNTLLEIDKTDKIKHVKNKKSTKQVKTTKVKNKTSPVKKAKIVVVESDSDEEFIESD
jgi:S-adenosylmethionine/arginine decarboxylase-like enzyme